MKEIGPFTPPMNSLFITLMEDYMRSLSLRPFSLFEDFDRDFDKFFAPNAVKEGRWNPFSRIKEEEKHYHLALDIPGVDKEHLKVELDDNILSIAGERKDHFSRSGQEVDSSLKFARSFALPKDANAEEIEVSQENGILDIIIPKISFEAKSKKLDIKSGKGNFLGRLME